MMPVSTPPGDGIQYRKTLMLVLWKGLLCLVQVYEFGLSEEVQFAVDYHQIS